jgi:hypothetical protein
MIPAAAGTRAQAAIAIRAAQRLTLVLTPEITARRVVGIRCSSPPPGERSLAAGVRPQQSQLMSSGRRSEERTIATHSPAATVAAMRRPRVWSTLKWSVVVVVVLHGLLHLLGAAKGLGWADVSQLRQPIGVASGIAWLAAAALMVATGLLLAAPARWWWMLGGIALTVSQALIATSWNDAKAGTIVNVGLAAAVVYQYAARGPHSLQVDYRSQVGAALVDSAPLGLVTEVDLTALPTLVATYVRRCGAVGRPRVRDFRATIHGRIRGGTDKPWMSFVGEQVNTYSPRSSRLFRMDASMFGLPVDVLHLFVDQAATMRVRLCSLIPMVNASGAELDRAETVTVFNDLCVLAPAALVDAAVGWQQVDDLSVRGSFTRGQHTVNATLTFDTDGDLVDFHSDDRSGFSPDGKQPRQRTWFTPVGRYRTLQGRRVATFGEARWLDPMPGGEFAYLEFHVDDIAYNVGDPLRAHHETPQLS